MSRLLKAPLLWFIVVGSLLFVIDSENQKREDNTIRVSAGDIQQVRDQWEAQSGQLITPELLDVLIQEQIQERRLYREALALGLDNEDVIIRRRMAQKLRFLTEDLVANEDVTEAHAETYFKKHVEDYLEPTRISFQHIYFGQIAEPGSSQQGATLLAQAALTQLLSQKDTTDTNQTWRSLGDPFMLGRSFQDRSIEELDRQFGAPFTTALVPRTLNQWFGPIESSFGLHLIRVNRIQPPSDPDHAMFTKNRERIFADYRTAQRRIAFEIFLEKLAEKYPTEIEPIETESATEASR